MAEEREDMVWSFYRDWVPVLVRRPRLEVPRSMQPWVGPITVASDGTPSPASHVPNDVEVEDG